MDHSSDDDEEKHDFISILEGTKVGREFRGVKRRAGKLPAGGTDQKAEMQTVEAITACREMQLKNIGTMDQVTIKRHMRKIDVALIDLPERHKFRITSRLIQLTAAKGDTALWASRAWPFSDSLHKDWSHEGESCCFATCRPADPTVKGIVESYFKDVLHAIFCDSFMEGWCMAGKPGGSAELLVVLLRAILKQVAACGDDIPTWATPYTNPILQVLRGALALCDPVPCISGATLADVEYLAPSRVRSSSINRDLPTLGKIFIDDTTSDDSVWKTRKTEYIKHGGSEATRGKPCADFVNIVDDIFHDPMTTGAMVAAPGSVLKPIAETYAQNVATWKSLFRPGCLTVAEGKLVQLIAKFGTSAAQRSPSPTP